MNSHPLLTGTPYRLPELFSGDKRKIIIDTSKTNADNRKSGTDS